MTAAPAVLVVAGTGLVVASVNAGVEALTGKTAVEWTSDLILDTGVAIGKGFAKATSSAGKWFKRMLLA